ncbi:glycosyltransferase family 2 protein [Hymenobacter bucti]|uniref:Glycosyltransferase family 2 protein n=1 Tax=Hymenobacter bucti TaxID=1844114 RepID=A0ABW4QVC8_9BACT
MEPPVTRTPAFPPSIAPLALTGRRPLWSVMIPAYNCTVYLADALRSVLAQDLGADLMQIEVVDDASTDGDVAALVAALGRGRVQYYRQPANVGSLRNFETCLNRSRGHYVHLLHGDDRVAPGYYARMSQLFEQHPEAGAAFSNYASIDEAGHRTYVPAPIDAAGILPNWLVRIAERQQIQYAAIAVRRRVYEELGSFYGTNYGEDWEMWVRIARYHPVAYTPEVLAEYRGHASSISSTKARQGRIIQDLLLVMESIQQHLPDKDRKQVALLSRKFYATLGIGMAYQVLRETQDWPLAQNHIRQALAMSKHPSVYYHMVKFHLKQLLHKLSLHA